MLRNFLPPRALYKSPDLVYTGFTKLNWKGETIMAQRRIVTIGRIFKSKLIIRLCSLYVGAVKNY